MEEHEIHGVPVICDEDVQHQERPQGNSSAVLSVPLGGTEGFYVRAIVPVEDVKAIEQFADHCGAPGDRIERIAWAWASVVSMGLRAMREGSARLATRDDLPCINCGRSYPRARRDGATADTLPPAAAGEVA